MVLALLLVALSVGLDNFGAATAIGVSGVDRKLRLRVAVIFGIFEAAMPVIGLVLGHSLARHMGSAGEPVGGTLLGLAGTYAIVSKYVGSKEPAGNSEVGVRNLIVIGAALSIDNLVIGFALGNYHVNLVVAAAIIAAISVALSLLGLEIGGRLGQRLGQRSELVGGAVLILVGVAIGTGLA
jgi:putative Mn2+ efflux pump MntP